MTSERHIPPTVANALSALKARVRRRFLIHGLGWMVAAAIGVLLIHYGLDRLLILPTFVRIVLLAAIGVFLFRGLRRRIAYPLSRSFEVDDMALLVERGHPVDQSIISAVQLDPEAARGDSPDLIRKLHDEAAERIRSVPPGSMLRSERTVRVWGIAGGLLLAFGLSAAFSPASFGVWFQRLFGSSARYPRKTFLAIEVPEDQGNYKVTIPEDAEQPIEVAVARGGDLPINVDVAGSVPNVIELLVEPRSGSAPTRTQNMSRRGVSHFRFVFRRLLHPIRLYARGGDDPGTRPIVVSILTPPAVTDLSVAVRPPSYTGLKETVREGGLVESLAGSDVAVSFRSTEPLNEAWLQLQESGQRLPAKLIEAPVPKEEPKDDQGVAPRWVARFAMPEKADRYRINLLAKNGLKQLSPGLHSIVPTPDRKPRVRLLTPGSSLQSLTAQAAFPLRLLATDDYGLRKITLASRLGPNSPSSSRVLWEPKDGETGTTTKHAFLQLFSPKDLLAEGERKPREGDRLSLQVKAIDNRDPEPQDGIPQEFKVDLLDVEELRRRLQARLRNTRRTVERALKVQLEQASRLDTFAADMSAAGGLSSSRRRLGLTAAEAGQQRVRGFLLQIRGDLGEVLDAHLFNGLDPSPAITDVIALYMRYYGEKPDAPATDPLFYVELDRARKAGQIGNLDLIGKLGNMFMIGHRILEEHLKASLRSLAAASTAEAEDKFQAELVTVQKSQKSVVEDLNELLRLLEDWNDYQDVVRMTRQLRDAERDLMERIRLGR